MKNLEKCNTHLPFCMTSGIHDNRKGPVVMLLYNNINLHLIIYTMSDKVK